MKKWETNYCGHSIVFENRIGGERLYVNDELQDEQVGIASRSSLWGQFNAGETIKVSLGGIFKVHCRIFVNNELILSD